jgi:conjugative transfer signal peptidase TraF
VKTSSWVFLLWFGAVAFWGVVNVAHWMGWRINHTCSLPLGFWRLQALNGPILRGQIVSFCPPNASIFQEARHRGYLGRGSCPGDYEPLLKPVVLLANQVVR